MDGNHGMWLFVDTTCSLAASVDSKILHLASAVVMARLLSLQTIRFSVQFEICCVRGNTMLHAYRRADQYPRWSNLISRPLHS